MKNVLITGASGDIGKAIAAAFLYQGDNVVMCYHLNEPVCTESALKCQMIGFDVRDRRAARMAVELLDDIDVLVNNAGIVMPGYMAISPDSCWDDVIDTNINGWYNVTMPVLQKMIRRKKGSIINVTSIAGLDGFAGQVNYSASKAAIIGATKALAQELGPLGLRVNAVAPGYIRTKMTQNLDESKVSENIPLRRFGHAFEVANVVKFLASDDASYVNGAIIRIDGGGV